nr:MAG TPA: minor tail protein [Caudoviricetes sp.]
MAGRGREFRTTINIGGDIDPSVRAAIESMAARLEMLEDVAENAQNQLEDLERASRNLENGFTIAKGAAADLVSSGIQAIVGAAKDAAAGIYGLAESTREFRQDMGTLETAFDSAGFSAETATETWKGLYSVFGEDDRAVEAANNIARMADSQEELDEWVRITTGVWGTYQDALPVEGLAEAAGETAKVGKVTGVMADALNWSSEAAELLAEYMGDNVTNAEDAFNVALSECSDEAERQALITDTLTVLYGEAADKYEETAGTLMDANAANADYTQTLAEMGERIEPVTTAVQQGFTKILNKIMELIGETDFTAIAEQIGDLTDKVITLADDGIGWLKDNMDWLIPVVGGLTAGLVAYKLLTFQVAEGVTLMTLAEKAKGVVMAIATGQTTAAAVATNALGVATKFLFSPLTIAITVIAALTAGVIWLYNNWDTAKEHLIAFGNKVSEIWNSIAGWITGAIETISQYFPVFGAFLDGVWQSIQDVVGNIKAIFGGVIDFISNIFAGNWGAAWQNIVDIFGNIFGMIMNIAKAPINGVISIVNKAINAINSIGFDVPDWVPLIGGKGFHINIPNIPLLATGGFTNGPSIAGEAGTEAVISFDPAYRAQNLAYWAKAGRMLGADEDGTSFSLSGGSSGGDVNLGGVTFAPNITVTGQADKESIMDAIEAEYPEFIDMLEAWFAGRGKPVYG